MGSCRLVEDHSRWLMGDNDVCIIRYQFFRMVISQSEFIPKKHSLLHTMPVSR